MMPGLRLNYDVKIGPKPSPRRDKKIGAHLARAEMQGSSLLCSQRQHLFDREYSKNSYTVKYY